MSGGFEDTDGAEDVGVHVLEGPFDGGNDVPDAREVKDVPDVGEQGRARLQPSDVPALEGEVWIGAMVGQITLAAPAEIVEHPDAEASGQEKIDHVAPDESGATGDERDGLPGHAAL